MRKRYISHAHNWVMCHAWQPMQGQSSAATDGINDHKKAEELLLNGSNTNDEGIQLYIDEVRKIIDKSCMYGIETVVDAKPIHQSLTVGKIDFWGLSKNHKRLDILDLKTGFVDVSPFEHWSLMAYAYCLLDKLYKDRVIDNPDIGITLNLVIVHPKSYIDKVKKWMIPATDLRGYINKLRSAVVDSIKDKPLRTAGKQCLRCVERCTCGTFDFTIKTCAELCSTFDDDISIYSLAQRIRFLTDLKKMCEGMIAAESEKAISILTKGEIIPGLALNEKKSLSWKDDENTKTFLEMSGFMSKSKPVTVKQAIKMGHIPESLINKHTTEEVKYDIKVI